MFALGIINIVVGGIIVLTHFFKQFEYITHETENTLILLIGTVFLCTGFVLLAISKIIEAINENSSDVTENSVQNCFDESNSLLEEIKDLISNLEANTKGQENLSSEIVSKYEKYANNDVRFENCEFLHRNGRIFAFVDGNLYCTKCHAFIDSDMKSMCPNCGSSLME